ncbi:unnamed protein product [Didymodactylos carnosus]|uniref:Uncharacterized protein n=1 Tax=Didymodactylos carnosus TaxID=1234261 RepID=A0A815E651_9BILA|nr:unnamed protein product [Didymodactylos carnosus]CAF4140892.1 unnamed protein product [Didymodactylos carnosus]
MSLSIISQHCKTIQEQYSINVELKLLLDDIVQELNKLKENDNNEDLFYNSLQEILLIINNVDTSLLNHELFFILRDILATLFSKWNNLSEQEAVIFQMINTHFYNILNAIGETNIEEYKILFCNKTLIDSIILCVDSLATNDEQYKSDTNLSILNCMIIGLNHLQVKQKQLQDDSTLLALLDSLVNLICSHYYVDALKDLELESTSITIAQDFLLETCPLYIVTYDGTREGDISETISNFLFPSHCLDIFQRFTSTISSWTNIVIRCMSSLMSILQYIVFRDNRKLYGYIHLRLVDHIYIILNGFTIENIEDNGYLKNFILYTIIYLYSFTVDLPLLTYIKQEKDFIPILLKLIEVNNSIIQVNAYRVLATILSEDDVKQLENPSKITQVFVEYIALHIDNMYRKNILETTLLGLISTFLCGIC